MENINPHLVVGSVWARTTTNSTSTVLAVSNQDLSQEVLEKFPQQVVFLTSKYKILTQDVDTFLRSRVYQGLDTNVISLMEALTTEPEPEEDDDVDIDSVDIKVVKDGFEQIIASVEEDSEDGEDDNGIPVFEPAEFDGLALDAHFLSYSESPYHTGDTMHTLRFALDRDLSIDQLRSVFRVTSATAIESFEIDSVEERVSVDIDAFVQVFLEVGAGGDAVGCVCVLSQGDYRAKQAGDYAPPAEAEQPVAQPEETVLIPQLQVVTQQLDVVHQQV